MRSLNQPMIFGCLAVLLSVAVGGCAAFGAGRLPADRFDYNAAIAQSSEEQMLTNLVRMRYLHIPEFLEVSSVLTQYTYDGGIGVSGQRGFGRSGDVIGGNANLGYAERPTITYSPLSGREFSKRMLSPISVEFLFSAALAGWPMDLLSLIAVQRMNHVENMSFGAVPTPVDRGTPSQFDQDIVNYRRFQALLELQWRLIDLKALEGYRSEKTDEIMVELDPSKGPETTKLIAEYKQMLGLDPDRNRFRVTDRDTAREPDEITIKTRSLLAIMSFLARGIDVPREHVEQGRVVPMLVSTKEEPQRLPIPLDVKSVPAASDSGRPEDASVAVRYKGHWFYIADNDVQSKRTFGIARYIYNIQAPSAEKAAPLISLPTG